ncbi:MAG TPA: hypothetical protein VIV66_05530 [Pyrinomonadaceae bacterium]
MSIANCRLELWAETRRIGGLRRDEEKDLEIGNWQLAFGNGYEPISNRQSAIGNDMTPKEIAAHYEAKVFDAPEAAKVAGFILTETAEPRNVWNKASAATAIILKLVERRSKGDAEEIGLVIEPWSITGCYRPRGSQPAVA